MRGARIWGRAPRAETQAREEGQPHGEGRTASRDAPTRRNKKATETSNEEQVSMPRSGAASLRLARSHLHLYSCHIVRLPNAPTVWAPPAHVRPTVGAGTPPPPSSAPPAAARGGPCICATSAAAPPAPWTAARYRRSWGCPRGSAPPPGRYQSHALLCRVRKPQRPSPATDASRSKQEERKRNMKAPVKTATDPTDKRRRDRQAQRYTARPAVAGITAGGRASQCNASR